MLWMMMVSMMLLMWMLLLKLVIAEEVVGCCLGVILQEVFREEADLVDVLIIRGGHPQSW